MNRQRKIEPRSPDPVAEASLQSPSSAAFLPEESLPYAFAVVANRISSTRQKMYSGRFGISVVGWRITAILGSHSLLSAKALAERVALDQVTVARAVDQLVGCRYVSRRVDPEDRRRVVLRLTKKGGRNVTQTMIQLARDVRARNGDAHQA